MPLVVAPHAGAWIETKDDLPIPKLSSVSPLTQGRGSKLSLDEVVTSLEAAVAPHAGAWIETHVASVSQSGMGRSPLTQGRGSKLKPVHAGIQSSSSPLTQGRGSKQIHAAIYTPRYIVAPHAGAWIETVTCRMRRSRGCAGRPSRRGVDRNRDVQDAQVARLRRSPLTQGRGSKLKGEWVPLSIKTGRPSRRGVDRNAPSAGMRSRVLSRPSRRGVDRNYKLLHRAHLGEQVAPHAGAWIETMPGCQASMAGHRSPLTQGRGSKHRGNGHRAAQL